jgi:hypothetical protein
MFVHKAFDYPHHSVKHGMYFNRKTAVNGGTY